MWGLYETGPTEGVVVILTEDEQGDEAAREFNRALGLIVWEYAQTSRRAQQIASPDIWQKLPTFRLSQTVRDQEE